MRISLLIEVGVGILREFEVAGMEVENLVVAVWGF